MSAYPNQLAQGVTNYAQNDPCHLFAGEMPVVTDNGLVGGADIAQLTVCYRNAAGVILSLTAALVIDATVKPNCVAAQPLKANTRGPIYTGGFFNHEVLIWPAGNAYDTLDERKGAFVGTIKVGKLL